MVEFRVEFSGKHRPANLDAVVCAFRVYADGDYFQFFNAGVSGIALSSLKLETDNQRNRFWNNFVDAAGAAIEEAIRNLDGVPLEDRTHAFEIDIDLTQAGTWTKTGNTSPPNEDTVVRTFCL